MYIRKILIMSALLCTCVYNAALSTCVRIRTMYGIDLHVSVPVHKHMTHANISATTETAPNACRMRHVTVCGTQPDYEP